MVALTPITIKYALGNSDVLSLVVYVCVCVCVLNVGINLTKWNKTDC